ncbi:MAG: hypothetical protein M1479_10250 [Actinobacteria bacterium]|nr:hypothetical protein [Cyanobacteriota bacterium]MCL5772633.1 hypothetical protein [Actinomycetota bacterium]
MKIVKDSWRIQHGERYIIKLKFSNKIADFIKEIKWHPTSFPKTINRY